MRAPRWAVAALITLTAAGCTASPAPDEPGPAPVEYRPGELYRDPLQRFALRLPAGWTRDAEYRYSSAQDPQDWHPSGAEAAFYDAAVPVDPALADPLASPSEERRTPVVTISVQRWSRDLDTAVAHYREGLSLAYPPDADRPVALADGTPAHLFAGLHRVGGYQRREIRLRAVSGGWLFDVSATEGRGDLAPYGTRFFESALRTLVVPGDPPPGRWPWPPVPHVDPAGRFSLLVPAGFEVDPDDVLDAVRFADPQTRAGTDFQRQVAIRVSTGRAPFDLAERVELGRRASTDRGVLLRTDEPLVLGDGTPAHLLGGITPASGTYSEGAEELAFDLVEWRLYAIRDGAEVVVSLTGDPTLLGAYPVDMVDSTLRSLRMQN